MGRTRSSYGRDETIVQNQRLNIQRARDHLKDLDIYGGTILKRNIREISVNWDHRAQYVVYRWITVKGVMELPVRDTEY
jgi:hypothetical protein